MISSTKELNIYTAALARKKELTRQEKYILRYYAIYKYFVQHSGEVSPFQTKLKETFSSLRILKNTCKIKSLKSIRFFISNPYPYSFYIGSERAVYVCSNGQFRVFANGRFSEEFKFFVNGKNIFENSLVINKPQKTMIINKEFYVQIEVKKELLNIKCSKVFDEINLYAFSINLGSKIFPLTKAVFDNLNKIFCNACREEKVKNQTYLFDVRSKKDFIDLINTENTLEIAKIFGKNIKICGVFLTNNCGKNTKTVNGISFKHNILYYAHHNTYKFSVLCGTYYIVRSKNSTKIISNKDGLTVTVNSGCVFLNGFEMLIISNAPPVFTCSGIVFPFSQNIFEVIKETCSGFFAQKEWNDAAREALKILLKEKRFLKEAASHLLSMTSTVKTAAEREKLFKLSALISRLPERKKPLQKRLEESNICAKIIV